MIGLVGWQKLVSLFFFFRNRHFDRARTGDLGWRNGHDREQGCKAWQMHYSKDRGGGCYLMKQKPGVGTKHNGDLMQTHMLCLASPGLTQLLKIHNLIKLQATQPTLICPPG